MALEPAFIGDSNVTYTRKCIVFPAQKSEPDVVDMTIRTVTEEDTYRVSSYSRTVDLLGTYGSEYRKARMYPLSLAHDRYVLYYNMSLRLPLNRCIARLLDLDANNIGSGLFWRGDAVAMKFERESEYSYHIDCHDADSSAIGDLEDMLRDAYSEGILEEALSSDEHMCKPG